MARQIYILLATLAVSAINAQDDLIVQLPQGKIRGHILSSQNKKPYYAFQEIPYAAPPVGNLRFKLPVDPQPWSDILNATQNKVICYQTNIEHPNMSKSEDCLYINVYSPVPPSSAKKLPVLFWIHGGRFMRHAGTFDWVGPKYVMDHDVIAVSFNYRGGPFGFLTTDDEIMPANLGLKDQLKALEWAYENIGLFGGDNQQITIAGESAGAMSISLHLLGPWTNNKQLYKAAILQSGSLFYNSRQNEAREEAFRAGKAIDKNFSSQKSEDLLKLLQSATSEQVLESTKNRTAWEPIMEKSGPFQYQTWEAFATGNVKKIPILLGFNSEESISQVTSPTIKQDAAALDADPSKLINVKFNISAINRTIAGNLMKKLYTTSFEQNIGAYIRFSTDGMTTPTTTLATLHSKYADVYLYQFAYKGELGGRMDLPYVPGCERVAHAEDLGYIWDDKLGKTLDDFPAADGLMLRRFVKLWTNFVKYQNPTPVWENLLQNVTWHKLDSNKLDEIPYLNMNVTLELRTNPRYFQKVKQILDQYVSYKDIL